MPSISCLTLNGVPNFAYGAIDMMDKEHELYWEECRRYCEQCGNVVHNSSETWDADEGMCVQCVAYIQQMQAHQDDEEWHLRMWRRRCEELEDECQC